MTVLQAENPARTVRTMLMVALWREPVLKAEQAKRQFAGLLATLLALFLRGD